MKVQNLHTYTLFQSVFTQLNDFFSDQFSVIFHRHSSAQDSDSDSGPHSIESITASITAVSQPVAAVLANLLTETLYDAASDLFVSAPACAP